MRTGAFPSGRIFFLSLGFAVFAAWSRGAQPAPILEFKMKPVPTPPAGLSGGFFAGDDASPEAFPRPVAEWLEAQIALARAGFSCGPIDGVGGPQTAAALRAFQENEALAPTGALDTPTRARLVLESPPLAPLLLTAEDLARLQPVSPTWLGKSQQTALEFETALELIAERTHASITLIRLLNPSIDWEKPKAGALIVAPALGARPRMARAAQLHIRLAERVLQVRDHAGRLIAHFPVSIAREVDKRPEGELRVTVVIPNPDYTFNPEVFPESEEGRELGRKLVLPPGPNNPVGVAWLGLDRPGYGIHGTPRPEQVGRTESHGCFRLANWDAEWLVELAWTGLPLLVDP